MSSSWFDPAECSLALTQLHGLMSSSERQEVTQPSTEPPITVFGIHGSSTTSISVTSSALWWPVAFGLRNANEQPGECHYRTDVHIVFVGGARLQLWSLGRRCGLAVQALKAFRVSTGTSIAAGAIVAPSPNQQMSFTFINMATMCVTGLIRYLTLGTKRREIKRLVEIGSSPTDRQPLPVTFRRLSLSRC